MQKSRDKNIKDKRIYIVFGLMLFTIIFATIASAALNQELQISGDANFNPASSPITCEPIWGYNMIASGNLGGTNPAEWQLFSNGTVTIGAGTAQTGSGSAVQSRFPEIWRPHIECIVFNDTVTAGANMYDFFARLPNLVAIENIHLLNTTNTIRMTRMFSHTPSLVAVDLSSWNTPNLQVIYRMFYTSGIEVVNLGGSFNPVNVTNMGSMFWHSANLTSVGDLSGWDTGNVIRSSRMFQGTHSLQAVDVSNWNTSSLEIAYHMFDNARSITTLDLSGWDTSNVTRTQNMFANAWNLTTIGDISQWNTTSVDNMNSMFRDARSLVSLNLSGWDTRHMTGNNMNLLLGGTLSLREITLGEHFWVPRLEGSNPSLPNVPNDVNFTGRWRNVGVGTVNNPLGEHTPLSTALMDNSLGIDIVNTWVWEPRT